MNILASKVKVSPEERKRLRELYHPAFARLSASFACAEAEANMSNNTQTEISETIKANAVKLKTRIILSKRQ